MYCEEICKVISETNILRFLVGLIIALGVGEILGKKVRSIHKNMMEIVNPPKGITKEDWNKSFHIDKKLREPIKWLGRLEVILFFISICIGKPEFIGIWLAFKVASKWEAWQNITKVPQEITRDNNKIDDLEYLGARNRIASVTVQKFLIGTGGNILSAFIGIASLVLFKN